MASILARSLRGAVVRGTEAAAGQAASVQQLQLHTSSACSGSLQIPDRLKDIPTAAVSILSYFQYVNLFSKNIFYLL